MRQFHVEVGEDTLAAARGWAQDPSWALLEKRLNDLDADLMSRAALAKLEDHDQLKGQLEGCRITRAIIQDMRDNLLSSRNR